MRIAPRIRLISVIGVSSLVLFICIAAAIEVWLVQGKVAVASTRMLQTVDESARVIRNNVSRVDRGLATVEDVAGKIESASTQLAQNVTERGVVLMLLPEAREQELTAAVASIQEDFAAIKDLLKAVNETIQAVNGLPFIDLPGKGLAALETLDGRIAELTEWVNRIKADIHSFRSGTAGGISQITAVASEFNLQVVDIRSNLRLVDAELENIQVLSRELKDLLPALLTSIAVVITLLAAWVGYSQIVMAERAIKRYRAAQTSTIILETVDQQGAVVEAIEAAPSEVAVPGVPLPADAESQKLAESGQSAGSPS